jgi:hypothetical protein
MEIFNDHCIPKEVMESTQICTMLILHEQYFAKIAVSKKSYGISLK